MTLRRTIACAVVAAAAAAAATGAAAGDGPKLPPETLRGPHDRLHQYPTLSLATPAERRAAVDLVAAARSAAWAWTDPRAAAAAGYRTKRPLRRPGDERLMWFHAEHLAGDDGRDLDPTRPEVLIYADIRSRPLVLVGVMFAMPRGRRGPTPGGPITRWHWHRVCARGNRRGVAPRPDGSCPRGTTMRNGSEMLHMWFTRDLRSAYAIHAPVHELCVARLLPGPRCRHTDHTHE